MERIFKRKRKKKSKKKENTNKKISSPNADRVGMCTTPWLSASRHCGGGGLLIYIY